VTYIPCQVDLSLACALLCKTCHLNQGPWPVGTVNSDYSHVLMRLIVHHHIGRVQAQFQGFILEQCPIVVHRALRT